MNWRVLLRPICWVRGHRFSWLFCRQPKAFRQCRLCWALDDGRDKRYDALGSPIVPKPLRPMRAGFVLGDSPRVDTPGSTVIALAGHALSSPKGQPEAGLFWAEPEVDLLSEEQKRDLHRAWREFVRQRRQELLQEMSS